MLIITDFLIHLYQRVRRVKIHQLAGIIHRLADICKPNSGAI